KFAFWVCCLIAFLILVIFTIIAIIRTCVKEKSEGTPTSIVMKALKALALFMCVPVIMTISMWLLDSVMVAIYNATLGAESSTLGSFLFVSFSQDTQITSEIAQDFLDGNYLYTDTDMVWTAVVKLSDFDFIFSWIASVCIIIPIARLLLMFVDRAISIVLLYIAAPFSISSSVLDDGQRAKLWRDQVLVKFITGYGAIVGLNIYLIVVSLVMNGDVQFFSDTETQILPIVSNGFLNNILKIFIIIGGAFSMHKVMAVVGNLVASGAGSNELREAAMVGASMKSFAGGLVGGIVGAPASVWNFGMDAKHKGLGSTIGNRLGFKTENDYKNGSGGGGAGGSAGSSSGGSEGGSGNGNPANPNYKNDNNNDKLKQALQNNDNKNSGSNQNDNKGKNFVLGAINQGNNLFADGEKQG
ncbi:MAG: hypothetical protein MJ072_00185, partial [Clostridia bacterium]|nr:hypothetical protein [Clostridia bacterium]